MRLNHLLPLFLLFLTVHTQLTAQHIPTPKEHFGFNIGDNYMLANFSQTEAYFKKLADASERVLLKEIGKTEEGRSQPMLIISSPANLKNLTRYQEISQKLARAEQLTDNEAKALAEEGKAVVWIDGGLHATETAGSHQLIETVYQLASNTDAETKRIMDDVIILVVHANPDGQELVADWYMREKDTAKRNMSIPRLYQKYIGHDNNRDFYMNNMKESKNMSRILYIDWIPQIMYNHHQSSPAGAIVAGPPYRDPFNYAYDPLLVTGIDGVGAAMINRLNREGKPGFTRMSGSVFSTWWNGGLRTTAYFHNIVGLLTEMWGSPAPSEVPLVPDRLVPNSATPNPVTPRQWFFQNSIDYSVSLNYAVLDYASRNKDHLLYNIYQMGKNSIEKGGKDTWVLSPGRIDSVKAQIEEAQKKTKGFGRGNYVFFDSVYYTPEKRDPRGFIIPADQTDFFSAVKFINALIESGVKVEKATAAFTVEGKKYPAGSYIVRTAQAFRPHVLDMFEPQDHPHDFQYPGGPPVRPYDAAGWTPAFQTGIQFDRILNGFDGPFQAIPYGEVQTPAAKTFATSPSGYLLDPSANNSFMAVNELLHAKKEVYRLTEGIQGLPQGAFFVPAQGLAELKKAAADYGLKVLPAPSKLPARTRITPARIALYDYYGGSMPSGWTRWLMEQFKFPFTVVYPQDIDNGNLGKRFDVILFIDAPIPAENRPFRARQPEAKDVPAEIRNMLGTITVEKTVPMLRAFMEQGGQLITVGNSTSLAYLLDLPVKNALTTINQKGEVQTLSSSEYYIPGSILTASIDNKQPENSGMNETADIVFNNSNVFKFTPEAHNQGLRPLAWFSTTEPLKSGWAWGQSWLEHGILAFAAPVGKGGFYASSPQITFRAQPYGTFKMLFNQLYTEK